MKDSAYLCFHNKISMAKISATILTYNEERRIRSCLESLAGVVDEIIVVDSHSTDSTVSICEEYGCKVTTRSMTGFGAQRQYATSLTTYPYVLSIDADEALSPALREKLIKLKQEGLEHRVYSLPRLNFYCGFAVKHCGWYPDEQIRLFDKRYANWNLRDINERVIFRDSVRAELIDGEILHVHCDTPDEYEQTLKAQSAIKANVLSAQNKSITPGASWFRGIQAFFNTYILKGGILDGEVGRKISLAHFRAERQAYKQARLNLKQTVQ